MKLRLLGIIGLGILLGSCGPALQPESDNTTKTRVTTTIATQFPVQMTTQTIGQLSAKVTPKVAAEVSGRVISLKVKIGAQVAANELLAELDPLPYQLAVKEAHAQIRRLESLLDYERQLLRRNQSLIKQHYITQEALEASQAQEQALMAQLSASTAQYQQAQRQLNNVKIYAPVAGIIDQQFISIGDYLNVGQPLLQLIDIQHLRVALPFPETWANTLKIGQTVYLSHPALVDEVVQAKIQTLRPAISSNQAIEAILEIENPGTWQPGASIVGEVVLAQRTNICLPEASVVQRPNGKVVYTISHHQVKEQVVITGQHQQGKIEILQGLTPGAEVVVYGAAFLTDQAAIAVIEPKP